ncbi:early endosome antigen 1-like, partial [Battus philenor]|uniref:early endosome antigen 1-like n=1 Tax=Battus philenor TaxID=42288 RepID=UPI0035CF51B1
VEFSSSYKRRLEPPPKTLVKRSQSASPTSLRTKCPTVQKKCVAAKRRRNSLSPKSELVTMEKKPDVAPNINDSSTPDNLHIDNDFLSVEPDKEVMMPQGVVSKTMRSYATKRREFMKLRKNIMSQQNILLETYISLKEMEARAGINDNNLGDLRLISISGWTAHDLLLLMRNDTNCLQQIEFHEGFASQVFRQLHTILSFIPEEVHNVNLEIMSRRNEVLQLLRTKYRIDRSTYLTNMEWKNKNLELDSQTDKLNKLAAKLTEDIKTKIGQAFKVAKMPWIDRETLIKKIDRLQAENSVLQYKIEESAKKANEEIKDLEADSNFFVMVQVLKEQLSKERTAKEALKEVVSAAESMLRVARARIVTLEKQVKESKMELEAARRKHKELEQLFRHRELSYDARSKKLVELSKTGETTIETLTQQRDALELRVRELREQIATSDKLVSDREADLQMQINVLQSKLAEKEKVKTETELRVIELQQQIKESEEQLALFQDRCAKLVSIEKENCLDYLPSKEGEPTDRETELWKELQITRAALSRVEDELRQSRADKDNFLNSLSRIAQIEGDKDDRMATELLEREQRIARMQSIIEEQKENEKIMEQSMTDYENQLAALRLEVKRLRNYDCYVRDTPYQDLKTELLEMQMQVATLSRERSALVNAAASRALMLERHERAADMFAKITRARRELAAQLKGHSSHKDVEMSAEFTRSLSSLCINAAENWSALQAERDRVLQLESAILVQSLQLEREGRVRTQLERRRSVLEREILRHHLPTSQCSLLTNNSGLMI